MRLFCASHCETQNNSYFCRVITNENTNETTNNMCKIDAGVVARANKKTMENTSRGMGVVSLHEIMISTVHSGKTVTQTIPVRKLSESFGKSYAKIVRGGAEV